MCNLHSNDRFRWQFSVDSKPLGENLLVKRLFRVSNCLSTEYALIKKGVSSRKWGNLADTSFPKGSK